MESLYRDCDQEPIHIPGSLQPHGVLLVLDQAVERIVRHGDGAQAILQRPDRERKSQEDGGTRSRTLIGASLGEVIVARDHDRLRMAVRYPEHPHMIDPVPVTADNGRSFYALVHRTTQGVFVELWPRAEQGRAFGRKIQQDPTSLKVQVEEGEGSPAYGHVQGPAEDEGVFQRLPFAIGRASRAEDPSELVEQASDVVAELTGFDRVMVYRFSKDWDGEVVAERLSAPVASFLGQRFPASDIPAQARTLYTRNLLRLIPSTRYEPVSLVVDPDDPAVAADGTDLDMTYCNLRSVSPVHLEYMRNMGVEASFSVSMIVGGQLWGLIACHHHEPKVISPRVMGACQIYAEAVSQQVLRLENEQRDAHAGRIRQIVASIDAALAEGDTVFDSLRGHQAELAGLLDGYAVAACIDNRLWVTDHGSIGRPALQHHFGQQENLTEEGGMVTCAAPDLQQQFVGAAFIPLSARHDQDFLLIGRPETLRTVSWAGVPEKQPMRLGDGQLAIGPRRSFALWEEEVRDRSLPFSARDWETLRTLRPILSERLAAERRGVAEEALRKSELRLRDLSECTSDWFWETDEDGVLRVTSPRLPDMGGLTPDALTGRPLLRLLAHDLPVDRPADTQDVTELNRALVDGLAFHGLTVQIDCPDEQQRWVRLSGVPRFADPSIGMDEGSHGVSVSGRFLGHRGTGTDVTELKLLEEERVRAQRLESIGQMAGGIAHEISNVLQPILSQSHYALKRSEDPEFVAESLKTIHQGGLKAREILRGILTFARQMPTERQEMDLVPALKEALAFARPGLAPWVQITADFGDLMEDDPACRVMANQTELSQILLNLCRNAADAQQEHAAAADSDPDLTLTIQLRLAGSAADVPWPTEGIGDGDAQGGRGVRLSIVDTGPGIPHEIRARIFDPFFTTKPPGRGTGMGLAVVHGIIKAWHGIIRVESAIGMGTTFHIYLPSAKDIGISV